MMCYGVEITKSSFIGMSRQKIENSNTTLPLFVCFLPVYRRFGGKQAHWPYASKYFSPISRLLNAASKCSEGVHNSVSARSQVSRLSVFTGIVLI